MGRESKNVIATGASSGIGYEVALQMAKLGHHVLAIARRKEKLEQLQMQSKKIEVLAIDLNNQELKQEIQNRYNSINRIDVIINNAGQLINQSFIETSNQEFAELFSSNVLSAINLVRSCHPIMNYNSHIVNITSMGGYQGSSKFSGLSAYSTSKGALSVLTECLAEEFKENNISVNALALGAVKTEMLAKAFPGYEAQLTPQRIAEYIVEFALKGSEFYNGKILPVTLGDP